MKDKKQLIIYAIAILLGVLLMQTCSQLSQKNNSIKELEREYKYSVDSLNTIIENDLRANDSLKSEILELEKVVGVYEREVEIIKKKIWKFKKDTNERIDSINKLTDPELERFFTERYKRLSTNN